MTKQKYQTIEDAERIKKSFDFQLGLIVLFFMILIFLVIWVNLIEINKATKDLPHKYCHNETINIDTNMSWLCDGDY